jgi:hypothetical protein
MEFMPFLVVLAPALFCAMLVFVVEVVPSIANSKFMHTAQDVEWIKEVVMHSAYYGTVVAAVLGFKKDAHETAYLAALWFVVLLSLSRVLNTRLKELEEKELRDTHRKNAGMTRSVVRYEIEKAAQPVKGTWID